ncbi:unnamed protein product [Cylindrotheca closterium]|uniref:PDZ domain-containing protein n=1 Tax=Cylindrotheca closterium TaxID=2856 RepID=A0AAD2G1I6_9STRA|nr:unnamed protein product [Cylindrotheca closterium]
MVKEYDEDDNGYGDDDSKGSSTLLVVIVSLLFVAVFGGALVGGVLSGDANNGFYFTMIAASSIVVLAGLVFAIRYCCCQRGKDADSLDIKEGKGTFNSDEEEGEFVHKKKPRRQSKKGPKIRVLDPGAGVSDVSVLSPGTYNYDVESVMTDGDATGITSFAGRILLNKSRQKTVGFDFRSVIPGEQSRGRSDPPEAFESAAVTAYNQARQLGPKDPSAARINMNGGIQPVQEEPTNVRFGAIHTPSTQRQLKVIDVDEEASDSQHNISTPASVASSIFRGFFANVKKRSAGTPVARNFKPQGRPPMPGSSNANATAAMKQTLQTINGGGLTKEMLPTTPKAAGGVPPSPGKSSVFSIPPPRRVPSSPGGVSEAAKSGYSEGVASSTFDPAAHERALAKMRQNEASLGATSNDVPLYYDDDEDDNEEEDIYDVFAPPGPIGVVVDTTPKGCVVHSLRKTSSMQGLINPGDLIVALDDDDVTKLDASELTKLMARKAQQTERKFTLIAA